MMALQLYSIPEEPRRYRVRHETVWDPPEPYITIQLGLRAIISPEEAITAKLVRNKILIHSPRIPSPPLYNNKTNNQGSKNNNENKYTNNHNKGNKNNNNKKIRHRSVTFTG
ncbi:hypothetical protein E2C01_094471 [Portunus trituberculatus]|uniref:Uncharacterized protein n=1 Tax=Portunus trituberculatus TaxID=210409 RepID=A0A5B7JXP3_PORTR|nr:hypothetical protein [Portunus trituberculatus]